MSREQIEGVLTDIRNYYEETGKKINRIKVVGGEPFMHPDYDWMLTRLGSLVPDYCNKVKVDTNWSLPYCTTADVQVTGRAPKRKVHLPYLWSPTDLGLSVTPCNQPRVCGFYLHHLYKDHMPTEVWGLDELCKHCIHAAPDDFRAQLCKPLKEITLNEKTPTKSWEDALENYRRSQNV
jgi:hypothetical protein